MTQYRPDQVPPEAGAQLSGYLAAQLGKIASAFEQLESNVIALAAHSDVAHLPTRLSGGELARLNNALVAGDTAGYSQWEKLSAKSIGVMEMTAASAAFPNLGAGYQTIAAYDSTPFPARGMVMVPGTGRWVMYTPGIYQLLFGLVFEHNELNAGRVTDLRAHNVTKGTFTTGWGIGTGRNVGVSSQTAALAFALTSAEVGDAFEIQIGGGGTYSSVSITTCSLSIVALSEYMI